jgi:radical SAM superfamily enzyme YgiQ (UPF0313 family)
MKIVLVSINEGIISFGLRCISAVLKVAGFHSQTIFLPRETEGLDRSGFQYAYSESMLKQLAELTRDCDLIGISVMSNSFDNAVQITDYLHEHTKALIVWGGIHPTIRPEECLQHTDLVCIGEGEEAIIELVKNIECNKGYKDIANIGYLSEGNFVCTSLRALEKDLDKYPYPDYDPKNELIFHKGTIRPMNDQLMLYYLRWPYHSDAVPTYTTMMSRGCTWSCAYCTNSAFKKIFGDQWKVRRHSVSYFISELKQIITRYPGIKSIKIEDDVFLDNVQILKEFAEAYKREVNVPLYITGFQPSMVSDEKIKILIDAGMKQMRMGIQTCSISTLHNVYRRPGSLEQIQRAVDILHNYSDQIGPPAFDLLIDNPWESEEEQLKTLNFLLKTPKPYQVMLYSLTLYPGTDLYERGKAEGILHDEHDQVYIKDFNSGESTYINWLFRLFQSRQAPNWLMSILLSKTMRERNWKWLPQSLAWIFRGENFIISGWRALLEGNWNAFRHAFISRARWLTRGVKN